MFRFSKLALPLLASVMAFIPSIGSAHGIWVAQRHDDMAVVYGHGSSDEGYDPAKLTSLVAKAADGSEVVIERKVMDDHVTFAPPAKAVIMLATFDNGFWSKGADGEWVNKPKNEVPGATEGGQYLKTSVTYADHIEGTPKAQGMELEIVPSVDPTKLKAGDKLEITLLMGGKPVPDTEVIAEYTTDSDNKSIKTDANGKATIIVRNTGLNVVAASVEKPLDDKTKADEIGYFTTLTFNLHYHSE